MKSSALSDEKDLLFRLQKGDHHAFEAIYHLYKAKLIRNSLRLLKSADLVEELIQDLFIKIWEQRAKIDVNQPLNAYLFKVANNMIYDTFRKISRDKRLQAHLILNSSEEYNHIEKFIFDKENRIALKNAINLLPAQQQKVFVLCKFEEKSYAEVSEMLNISHGTINNHIYRANQFLKEYFSGTFGREIIAVFLLNVILLP
ncbi:MAG: sigma-70 family RNA polymerase sigma factor [Sphingobacteriaceae bacterium]|nr:sigma-70 family RNA polymerase sigma factor [Sphingobacteriaceae bacterium]